MKQLRRQVIRLSWIEDASVEISDQSCGMNAKYSAQLPFDLRRKTVRLEGHYVNLLTQLDTLTSKAILCTEGRHNTPGWSLENVIYLTETGSEMCGQTGRTT